MIEYLAPHGEKRQLRKSKPEEQGCCFNCVKRGDCWPENVISELEIHPMGLMNCVCADQELPKEAKEV